MRRYHPAAAGHFERIGFACGRRPRFALVLERCAFDPIDAIVRAGYGESESDRSLGQPVDRLERVRAQAIACKALLECGERIRTHRLGAVESVAPAGKVQALEFSVLEELQAKLIGKIGAARKGAAVVVD